jgi:hypothetical protein
LNRLGLLVHAVACLGIEIIGTGILVIGMGFGRPVAPMGSVRIESLGDGRLEAEEPTPGLKTCEDGP